MASGRYMVWISQETRQDLEEFVRKALGLKTKNVSEIVNLAEIVRKAICFAIDERKDEFRVYLGGS